VHKRLPLQKEHEEDKEENLIAQNFRAYAIGINSILTFLCI